MLSFNSFWLVLLFSTCFGGLCYCILGLFWGFVLLFWGCFGGLCYCFGAVLGVCVIVFWAVLGVCVIVLRDIFVFVL